MVFVFSSSFLSLVSRPFFLSISIVFLLLHVPVFSIFAFLPCSLMGFSFDFALFHIFSISIFPILSSFSVRTYAGSESSEPGLMAESDPSYIGIVYAYRI